MGSAKAISGMILGIISIVFSLFGYIPLIIGIVAIILSGLSLSKNETGKGMAITGLITGIIGTIFSLFYALIWTAILSI